MTPGSRDDGPLASRTARKTRATVMIALLRGVNVGGNKKVPMAELRELASGLGLRDVQSYIQSGNLVFGADTTPIATETAIEAAIERRFGFPVAVIVRSAARWESYALGTPFPDAEAARPHLLLLGLAKRPLLDGTARNLRAHARAGERVEEATDAIWIDYGEAIASSKLSPAVLDRIAGSTVTARNWRTVQKLAEMASAHPARPPAEYSGNPRIDRRSRQGRLAPGAGIAAPEGHHLQARKTRRFVET